ncbi:hypothetical protein N9R79_07790 [Vibrio sp.]|nr:hypothetical protein [Vibrio sp.]
MASSLLEFPAGKRIHPRVDFPVSVYINNQQIPVIDWSLGGFSIEDSVLSMSDAIENATLNFHLHMGELNLTIQCRPTRSSPSGYWVGFMFVDITPSQTDTLQSILHAHLSNEKIDLDTAIDQGVKGKQFQLEKQRLADSWFSFFLTFAFLLFTFSTLSYLLYQKLFVITSEYAAVSQSILTVKSDRSGELNYSELKVGQYIDKDDPLYQIRSQADEEFLRQRQGEIAVLSVEIQHLNNRLKETGVLLEGYSDRLTSNQSSIQERIGTLEEQILVQNNLYALIEQKYEEGLIDQLTMNEQYLKILETKKQLQQLKGEFESASNLSSMANIGLFGQDDVNGFSTVSELQDLLEYKTKHHQLLTEEVDAFNTSLIQYSPCDCYITELNSPVGVVTQFQPIVALSPHAPSQQWVLALVSLNEANALQIDAPVTFSIASSHELYSGRVVDVGYYNPGEQSVYDRDGHRISGLPETLPRTEQYMLVKILPNEAFTQFHYREPAKIKIELNPKETLLKWIQFL